MSLIEELEEKFGRSITAKELAKLLRVNPRTINQYAHFWGGIKVTPTHYRFFEKQIIETFKNAFDHNKEGQAPLPGSGNGSKKPKVEAISRHWRPITKRRDSVGNRHKKATRTRVDGHGLFVNCHLDE